MAYLKHRLLLSVLILSAIFLVGCNPNLLAVTGKVMAARAQLGPDGHMAMMDDQSQVSKLPDNFVKFESRAHRVSLHHPEAWAIQSDMDGDRFIVLLSHDPTVFDGPEPDFLEPFTFLIAGARILEADEAQVDPLTLQAEFLADFELEMEPLSELMTTESVDRVEVSQDFFATDGDQAELEMTITTVIQDNRTITFLYGGNDLGLAEHGENLQAVADSVEIIDLAQLATQVQPLDFSDPVSVVDAIFVAALTRDYDVLPSLCDPLLENDDDTAMVCEITAGHEFEQEFITYFETAYTIGEAEIEGDEAAVPFIFGPGGDDEETMRLIKRDGKWYLSSF